MNIDIFNKIPSDFTRKYLKKDIDFENLEEVKEVLMGIIQKELNSVEDFNIWIEEVFEFNSSLREAFSKYHILSTCHTDDEEIKAKEKHFTNVIFPGIAELKNDLNNKIVDSYNELKPDEKRFKVYIRSIEAGIKNFIKKNIPLFTKLDNLSQEYFSLRGALTINFEDKEHTMAEMFKYLESESEDLRKRAWVARMDKTLEIKDRIDEIYEEMIRLRHEIALNLGYENFIDFKFTEYKRFDYTPGDCKKFHNSIEKHVVPVLKRIHEEKCKAMDMDKMNPWDTYFDYRGSVPLKPFDNVEELISRMKSLMGKLDPDFSKWVNSMDKYQLLDLESRKNKAPGGYSATLTEKRYPFIFMSTTGTDWDMRVLLHELGHSFHSFSMRDDLINYNSHNPMEFNEVASMAMEFIGNDNIEEFYSDEEDIRRSQLKHYERVVALFTSVATIDAFQYWIYENPSHTRLEREEKWVEMCDRFGTGFINWDGYENFRNHGWQQVLHIIAMPFYYVEYGIAQIGALQVWKNSKNDFKKTVESYKKGLRAGSTNTLPELFEHAGIKFDFGEEMLKSLMDEISKERFK